jgi:bifunctional UDP-N-acetylglucosamine pyrophosphorylase/glucosamine-1-phosphate N-acetyltransferase
MSLQAIILAAGRGTRMKSELPKVLHPICGRPMVAYAWDLAVTAGVRQPIIVLSKDADQVAPHLPKELKVAVQEKPLGTGDAVLAAKKFLGATGDLLILYADTPLVRRTTVQRLVETHRKSNATATLLTAHFADPTGYGRIVRDPTGIVTGIVEESDANAAERAIREVNVGPLVAKVGPLLEALAAVGPSKSGKEWYLTEAIEILAKKEGTKFQAVRIEKATEALGVNSRVDLSKAAAIIRQRILEGHMTNGVTVVDPQVTYIDQGVTIGQDTVIHPGTVVESGVVIGKRCSIGPYARLRAGVAIGDDTKIGNFAELVRAKVGSNVRVNHFSYLGDATIDDDVNIGAGTITANYDGRAKHQTTIGKGAFIGSDSVLVAPVSIGAGAVTGAGCVVPKGQDVPAKAVVVGVPARPLEAAGKKGKAPAKDAQAEGPSNGAKASHDGQAPSKNARKPRPARVAVAASRGAIRKAKPAAKARRRR